MAALSEPNPWKLAAAEAAAALVEDGMTVGLGSGSTASLAVVALGAARLPRAAHHRHSHFRKDRRDWPADSEFRSPRWRTTPAWRSPSTAPTRWNCGTLDLIKGLGGALLREKLVAAATDRLVIVVDESKLVDRLAADSRPLPVEVVAFAWQTTARRLESLGARATLRLAADGQPFVTDQGNYTLDCRFGSVPPARELQPRLDATVGVVEHGLFLGMTSQVIVGGAWGRARPQGAAMTMRAAVLRSPAPVSRHPLRLEDLPIPEPGPDQVLLRVKACGVCRTDLHVVEGELPPRGGPLIPGHQIVGEVAGGGRVGVSWIGGTDGACWYCRHDFENLCDAPTFTGYTVNGGYAEYAVARRDFVFPLPPALDDIQAAPLLCAGIIGFRSLRVAGVEPGERVGLFGFGASAHLAIAVLRAWKCEVYVATRGESHRQLAASLGAVVGGQREREAARPARPRRDVRAVGRRGGRRALEPAQGRRGGHQRHSPGPHAAIRLRQACCGASARFAAWPT